MNIFYPFDRRLRAFLVALVVLSAEAVLADVSYHTWKTTVADGSYSAASNWSSETVPKETNDVTRFFIQTGDAGRDYRVRFSDLDSKTLALSCQLTYPARITLDLTDATYRMVGTDVPRNRDGLWYPFHVLWNKESGSYAIQMGGLSSGGTTGICNYDPVLTWQDTVFTFANERRCDFACSYAGGLVDFVPGWESRGRFGWSLTFDADPDIGNFVARLDGCTMRVPTFFWGGMATNSCLVITNGATLTTYGHVYFPNNLSSGRTSKLDVVGGGRLVLYSPGCDVSLSGTADDQRRLSVRIAGEDSVLDASQRPNLSFNGANVTVEGGSFYTPSNTVILAEGAGASTRLAVDGGYFGPKNAGASDKPASLSAARTSTSTAEIEMNGGEFLLYPNDSTHASGESSALLGPGNVAMTVNGGAFSVGDFDLGYTGGDRDTWQTFTMNGGTSRISRLCLGVSRNDTLKWQHPTVNLNGGVLVCGSVFVHADACDAYRKNSLLTADGGTVEATGNVASWIVSFNRAELGPKGLVLDTRGYTTTLMQSMTNKSGQNGRLVKRGSGGLTLGAAAYDVAQTVVEEGTLCINTNKTLATELVLTNNASLSLAGGPTRLSVTSLTVPNGRLVVDKGDTVRVLTDSVNLDGLSVSFTSAPDRDEALNLFVFDGDVTANAGVRAAMRRLVLENGVADTDYAACEMTYDSATKQTKLSLTVREKESALTAKTVWNGPSWTADGWSAGLPTATTVASFSNGSAPTDVTVPTTAEAGALAFSSGSYTFAGDNELLVSAGAGAARIDVTSGSQTFNLPLAALYAVDMSLAAGTSVTIANGFRDGGLNKTGTGALTLAGETTFAKDSSVGGGLNTVCSAKAIAMRSSKVRLDATSDTLAFNASDDEPMTIGTKFRLASSATPSNAIVVKTDTDVTFTDFGVAQGVLVKRGAGKMTVCARSDAEVDLSKAGCNGTAKGADGTLSKTEATAFAADGTAPSLETEYCGLNVAEGELEIVGRPGDRQVNCHSSLLIGLPTVGTVKAASQPRLTIDGASVVATSGNGHATLGPGAGLAGTLSTEPELKVVNDGSISVPTWHVGSGSLASAAVSPRVTVTNGTCISQNAFALSNLSGPAKAIYRVKDASLGTAALGNQLGLNLNGSIDAKFENVEFGGLSLPAVFQWSSAACGTVAMSGGTFAVSNFVKASSSANLASDLTFSFDGTEWKWWDGADFTLAADALRPQSLGHFRMLGSGLKVVTAAGQTFRTLYPFEGTGGFVKEGDGTVAFGADTVAFTGLLDIRAGVADLTDAGELETLTVSGPGILRGATVDQLTICLTMGEDGLITGIPTLDNVTANRVIVDFGRNSFNPLDPRYLQNVRVATVTVDTLVSRWTLSGTGVSRLYGKFTEVDGNILMTATASIGFAVMFN